MLICSTLLEKKVTILIRAFFAIPIVEEDEALIKAALLPVKQSVLDLVRWTPVQNWHITMRFLGNISPKQVVSLSQAADQVASHMNQFDCQILKVAGFPSTHAKTIAASVKPTDALRQIVAALEEASSHNGLNKDPRRFRPHITLGKFMGDVKEFTANETSGLTIKAKELVLFESKLTDEGSEYIPLERFQFLD